MKMHIQILYKEGTLQRRDMGRCEQGLSMDSNNCLTDAQVH